MGHWARSANTRTVTKVDTGLGDSLVVCGCETDTNTSTLVSTGRSSNGDSRRNIVDSYRRGLGTCYAGGVSSVNSDSERLAGNPPCTVDMAHRTCSANTRAIAKVDTCLRDSLIVCRGETDTDTNTLIGGGRSSNSNRRSQIIDCD